MKKILNGIQSSGKPHMGNIIGSIMPSIEEANLSESISMFFIADLHSLTTVKDKNLLQENVLHVAAAWLACGLDLSKSLLYRQSRIPSVCELAWYLSCFTPYPMLANAHSFKDKSANLSSVNVGIFTYPVLMAADILIQDATHITVGKDQKQHIEIARDIASAVNNFYKSEIFVLPEALIKENTSILPGKDGRKMSKSYGNTIDLFAEEGELRKSIMSIKTDSTPVSEPKDYKNCAVYNLFCAISTESEQLEMKEKYLSRNFGYGEAKKILFEKILEKFTIERKKYDFYIKNSDEIVSILKKSESTVGVLAENKLKIIRDVLGY